jgi:mobilome CxxCx(11)CxxC protein
MLASSWCISSPLSGRSATPSSTSWPPELNWALPTRKTADMSDSDPAVSDRNRTEECSRKALDAFAMAWIFERRAKKLRFRLRSLTYIGLLLPVLVGGTVLAFGIDSFILPAVLAITAIAGLVQLAGSLWSVVANWVDEHAYAEESVTANNRLAEMYDDLEKNPPTAPVGMQTMQLLDVEYRARRDLDVKHAISAKERQLGRHAVLFRQRKQCSDCGAVPRSESPARWSNPTCMICGRA